MCRVLAYLGHPLVIDDVLYETDHSLIRQVYDPKLINLLNLAGFGFVAWDHPESSEPFTYRTAQLPMYDRNLPPLARHIRASALMAHIRGALYDVRQIVSMQNVHPFHYEGTPLLIAMNGDLVHFVDMRFDLVPYIRPEIARQIEGTTDTEWIYALILSQLRDPAGPLELHEIEDATIKALEIIREVREARGISAQSGVNLILSDGRNLVATRFVYDYGWFAEADSYWTARRRYDFLSLWYTVGSEYKVHDNEWMMTGGERLESILVASEPITSDMSRWVKVPEYAMLSATRTDGELSVKVRELEL